MDLSDPGLGAVDASARSSQSGVSALAISERSVPPVPASILLATLADERGASGGDGGAACSGAVGVEQALTAILVAAAATDGPR